MPIRKGRDFFQWGTSGKKYHFTSSRESQIRAFKLAKRQMKAIKANKGKGLIGRTVGSMVIEKGIKKAGDSVDKIKKLIMGGDSFIPDVVKKSKSSNYGVFSKHLKDRADKHWWAGPVAEALHAVGLGETIPNQRKTNGNFLRSRLPPPIMSNDSANLDFASKNRLLNATAAR